MAWTIIELDVKGVKGILEQGGCFDLKGKSIALYAPNGTGKSGYADAIEYFFSADGSVEHYGKGGPDSEHGGKHAIPHILAKEKGIPSVISIKLHDALGKKSVVVHRKVKTSRTDTLPAELEPIVGYAPAHRVLRSHDLRRFVVDLDPRSKFSELSKWLGLEQLEKVLTHLTTAEKKLIGQTRDAEMQERLTDISKHTNGEVGQDGKPLFSWCDRECKRYLGTQVRVESLADIENCIKELQDAYRKDSETSAKSKQLLESKRDLGTLLRELTAESGTIALTIVLLKNLKDINTRIQELTETAKESIFQEVWDASQQLLKKSSVANCPICLTPWQDSTVGSQERAVIHVEKGLSLLKELSEAKSKQEKGKGELLKRMYELIQVLSKIEDKVSILSISINDDFRRAVELLNTSKDELLNMGDSSGCSPILEAHLPRVIQSLQQQISEIKVEESSSKSSELNELTNHLIAIKNAILRLNSLYELQAKHNKVKIAFSTISEAIRKQVATVVDGTIAAMQKDMLKIYQKIDMSGAVPDIQIESDTQTKSLALRISFHDAARRLPPSGYLSESRLNSLGIALFVSSVKSFNKTFPFIVLDDIVSSYDADNRARIVDLIAEELKDFQIFLTTHDDRFYQMLKARLSDKGWAFHRITKWTVQDGPRRQEDVLKPQEVDRLVDEGDPKIAGNAVRQYMEEWLDDMCAKYHAFTLHKRHNKEFDRTLYDFWGPFVNRIEEIKGGFFEKRIMSEACFDRLKTTNLLNHYSHAQANPYEWPAIGDVKHVWESFTDFRKLFNCYSCKNILQYSHEKERLYCTCGKEIFPPE